MYKIRDLFSLVLTTSLSNRQIAKSLNIGKSSVSNYAKIIKNTGLNCDDITHLTDSELLEYLQLSNSNKSERFLTLSEYFPFYVKE